MSIFDFILMAVPVAFLIGSVMIAVKAVSHGRSRKRTLLMQLASFAFVFAVCMVCPFVASAASADAAGAAAAGAPARIPRRSVRRSSLWLSVKVLRFTVC